MLFCDVRVSKNRFEIQKKTHPWSQSDAIVPESGFKSFSVDKYEN